MDTPNPVTTSGYDLATAQFLSTMVGLAYAQFQNPSWNGQIPAAQVPAGFTQVAAFQVPEIDLSDAVDRFLAAHPELMPLVTTEPVDLSAAQASALNAQLSAALQDPQLLGQIAAGVQWRWFGFALAPTSDNTSPVNVISIRGTRTAYEWVMDASAVQVPVPLVWFSDGHFKLARVHLGFLILFAFLAPQITTAVSAFDANAGTQVAGHSLGSALATLASIYVKLPNLGQPVEMYNLASPRVGDSTFVSAFNYFVPGAYRVVNLSDLVPELPPTSATITVGGHKVSVQYGDVGQEWSYLWQTGNVGDNHGWQENYDPSIQQGIPTDAARTYPNSGIPC